MRSTALRPGLVFVLLCTLGVATAQEATTREKAGRAEGGGGSTLGAFFRDFDLTYSGQLTFALEDGVGGAPGTTTVTVQGGVILRVADLELYADQLVLWFQRAEEKAAGSGARPGGRAPAEVAAEGAAAEGEVAEKRGLVDGYSRVEVYAEGAPVLVVRGLTRSDLPPELARLPFAPRQLQGERVFLDLVTGRAIALEAAARSLFRGRDREIPLHVRAEEIRVTDEGELVAANAIVSTCEFGDPHWRIRPRELVVREGSAPGTRHVEATGTSVLIGDVPVLYVPRAGGDVGERGLGSKIPLQRVNAGQSSRFGFFLQTDWGGDLWTGADGDRVEWRLEADGYTRRGPAGGADLMWKMLGGEGFVDSYLVYDTYEDDRFPPRDHDLRGRARVLHRQPLGGEESPWRLDVELSYLSDRSFLEEYFEAEAETGKEQETVAYLRYLEGDVRGYGLAKMRINDFDTVTERLPEVGLDIVEAPLGGGPLPDGLLYYDSSSTLANLRRALDEDEPDRPLIDDSPRSWRVDTTHLLGINPRFGPVGVDLRGGVRHTGYERAPHRTVPGAFETEISRTAGIVEASAAFNLWRVFDVDIPQLDIQKLRHVITPTVSYLGVFRDGRRPEQLFFFDEVDAFRDVQVLRLGLQNRLQTRRAVNPSLEEGGVTDGRLDGLPEEILFVDLDAFLFPRADTDNDGEFFGGAEADLTWRIRDGLALVAGAEIGGGRRPTLDEVAVGLDLRHSFGPSRDEEPVDRTLDLVLAHRHRAELSSQTTVDLDFRVDAKWGGRMFASADWENSRIGDLELQLRRYTHDFVFGLGVSFDGGEDDFGVFFDFTLRDLDPDGRRSYSPGDSPPLDFLERDRPDRRAPTGLDGSPDHPGHRH